MKNILILIFLVIIFTGCKENTTETNTTDTKVIDSKTIEDKLIGEWVDASDSRNASLILNKSKHAIIVIDNQAIGGESYTRDDGVKAEVKFEVDENQNPMALDIVVYELGIKNETFRLNRLVNGLLFCPDAIYQTFRWHTQH